MCSIVRCQTITLAFVVCYFDPQNFYHLRTLKILPTQAKRRKNWWFLHKGDVHKHAFGRIQIHMIFTGPLIKTVQVTLDGTLLANENVLNHGQVIDIFERHFIAILHNDSIVS